MEVLARKIVRSVIFPALVIFLSYKAAGLSASRFFPAKPIPDLLISEHSIEPGASLYASLIKEYSVNETLAICNALGKVCRIKDVRPGEKYKIYHSTFGTVHRLIYMPDPLKEYVVEKSSGVFKAYTVIPDVEIKPCAVKGSITHSLYESMAACGLDDRTIMNFAEIFQWQVDFLTEVRAGDKFILIFDRYYKDGEPVKDGSIQTAVYKNRNFVFSAIRFVDGGIPDYYDADGNSFRKAFLKAPLNYSRISSYFTYHRRHPILKYVRPHLGIDYAAPVGTPVSSVGSGRVTFAGWKGGYGRMVIVRHNSTYTSQYAHLKSYGRGIKTGAYVNQGQVVGYVGSSGLSTGPHLDFRIKKNGRWVNYLKMEFPASKSVSKGAYPDYKQKVEEARRHLKYMESEYFSGKPMLIEDYSRDLEEAEAQKQKAIEAIAKKK